MEDYLVATWRVEECRCYHYYQSHSSYY